MRKDSKCSPCISDKVYVGNHFLTYFSFDFPLSVYLNTIISAKMILFKIPMNERNNCLLQRNNIYSICPTRQFVSIYQNWYLPTETENEYCLMYQDKPDISYTEIDITEIMNAWVSGEIENKGLLIQGTENSQNLTYASQNFEVAGMRPFLRILYEGITKPLSEAPCIVEVVN